MKKLAIALLFLATMARAQTTNYRFDAIAYNVSGGGIGAPMLALPGATVFFYSCANGVCSTAATTYQSATSTSQCPGGQQVTWQPPAPQGCQSNADQTGSFGGWFQPGQYAYIINGVSGPKYFTVGAGGDDPSVAATSITVTNPGVFLTTAANSPVTTNVNSCDFQTLYHSVQFVNGVTSGTQTCLQGPVSNPGSGLNQIAAVFGIANGGAAANIVGGSFYAMGDANTTGVLIGGNQLTQDVLGTPTNAITDEVDLQPDNSASAYSGAGKRLTGMFIKLQTNQNQGGGGTYPAQALTLGSAYFGSYWQEFINANVAALGPAGVFLNVNANGTASSGTNYNCPTLLNAYEAYWTGSANAFEGWTMDCSVAPGTNPATDTFTLGHGAGTAPAGQTHTFRLAGVQLEADQVIDVGLTNAASVATDSSGKLIAGSGGGVGSFTLISSQTLASPAASVTFSAIPQTYTNLKIIASLIDAASSQNVVMQFNGDSTSGHYASTFMNMTVNTPGGGSLSGSIQVMLSGNTVAAANDFTITNYASAGFKNVTGSSFDPAASKAVSGGGIWNQTGGVTSITLLNSDSSNFATGTVVSLYGVQ